MIESLIIIFPLSILMAVCIHSHSFWRVRSRLVCVSDTFCFLEIQTKLLQCFVQVQTWRAGVQNRFVVAAMITPKSKLLYHQIVSFQCPCWSFNNIVCMYIYVIMILNDPFDKFELFKWNVVNDIWFTPQLILHIKFHQLKYLIPHSLIVRHRTIQFLRRPQWQHIEKKILRDNITASSGGFVE